MTIKIGDNLPDGKLAESTGFGDACPLPPSPVDVNEAARGKRIAIFGVPGAFTPGCSAQHVPSFVKHYDELKAKKVDEIWCVAVNDGFVMAAWGRDQKALDKIRFLGDGSGTWTKALGLDLDLTAHNMGLRSQRYALLAEDGVVKQLNVEKGGKFEVSGADTLLKQLG